MTGGPAQKRLKLQNRVADRSEEDEDEGGELEDALVMIKEEFAKDLSKASEEVLKEMEETVLECAADLAKEKRTADLLWTLTACRAVLPFLGKAKASRMLRTLLDFCLQTEEMKDRKILLCNECIEWATSQKRTFLRRSLQARLIRLYNDNGSCTIALEMAGKLIKELKKMEDRDLLVEVVLEESKAAFALNNPNKARTSLVMAKTVSNTAFMTPILQAAIDLQSGILAAEDNDFRTAYSYFYESFENFESLPASTNDCIKTLKYMCLAKIVLDEPEHIKILLTGKRKFESVHLEAMKALGKAFEKRSLSMFHETNAKYEKELRADVVIAHHTTRLYDKLLEKEVIRVVEPYDVVDLDHLVNRIGLPMEKIERSVSALILDGRIKGVLDQSAHTLTVYRTASSDAAYKKAVNLIHVLERIVDTQYSHGYARVH